MAAVGSIAGVAVVAIDGVIVPIERHHLSMFDRLRVVVDVVVIGVV